MYESMFEGGLSNKIAEEQARPTLHGNRLYMKWLREQESWIAAHGGTLEAYIERYGDPGVPTCTGKPMYGEGGTAIFLADMRELERIKARLGR